MAAHDADYVDELDETTGEIALRAGADLAVPLTTDQARKLTESIRNASEVLWVLIAQAHAGKAWQALGYETWEGYVKAEFDMSRSRSYQILDQARVIAAIEAAVPEGTRIQMSEAAARDLKGVLDEVVPSIRERTDGLEASEATIVLGEIVEEQRERLREERDAAYANADEDDEPYYGTGSGTGNGTRPAAPAPVYDDIDEIDVSRIRRNVNAAHDLYSSLSALASLPDELEEVVAIIPEERHAQIGANLAKARDNLARFAELWDTAAGDEDDDDDI